MIHASALDQSGQSILPFLETGHYAEVSIASVDPDISGKIRSRPDLVSDVTNFNTGNMGNSFQHYNAALKLQLTEHIGLAFCTINHSVLTFTIRCNPIIHFQIMNSANKGTSVNVDTHNISMLLGISPFTNFQLYGGAVYQSVG